MSEKTQVIDRIVAQGEPVKGMTFGKLPELLSALGLKVNVLNKGAWAMLRTVIPILNITGFKVHPNRGGPFNRAFMELSPAERKKWATKVVENPPPDYEEHCKSLYRGKDFDPVQVFWDLVTIGNMPEAVAKVPMTTAHFRSTGLEVVKLVNAGEVDKAREALGRAPKVEVLDAVAQVIKPKAGKASPPKPKAAPKAAPKKAAKVPAKRKRSGGVAELSRRRASAPEAAPAGASAAAAGSAPGSS